MTGGTNKESQQHLQACFSMLQKLTETKVLGRIPLINQVNWFLISFPEKLDRLETLQGSILLPDKIKIESNFSEDAPKQPLVLVRKFYSGKKQRQRI